MAYLQMFLIVCSWLYPSKYNIIFISYMAN